MRKAKFNFSPAKQRKGFSFCIVYVSGKWEIVAIFFSLYISSNVKMAFVLIVSFFWVYKTDLASLDIIPVKRDACNDQYVFLYDVIPVSC